MSTARIDAEDHENRKRRSGFKLSGRIEAENVAEVKALLSAETSGRHFLLDLSDLTLVDQHVVSFLRHSEADGIELKNCPAYVREWMKQEKSRNYQRKQ